MKIKNITLGVGLALTVFTSCHNGLAEFEDFEYQAVYFAKQTPVRIVELGEDDNVDLTLDNQHKVNIMATMGGAYSNDNNRIIDFVVANEMCDNLYFEETGNPLLPMPLDYYSLASNQIVIPKGSMMGGVEVQLTDAFFNDPKSLSNNYVIPLRMTNVEGADTILSGKPSVENPDIFTPSDWNIEPKNYILYAVKYVNPWHGNYLRRGVDVVTMSDNTQQTVVRHEQYAEDDELVSVTTASFKECTLPVKLTDDSGKSFEYELKMAFDDELNCVLTSNTDGVTISEGNGKFVSKGEKNSLGGKDRDAIYLKYTAEIPSINRTYVTTDTLVLQTRGIAPETFKVVKK